MSVIILAPHLDDAVLSQFKMVNIISFGALKKPEAYRWEIIIRPELADEYE